MATECRARVLVIDDDPDIREILGYLLTTLGYDTHAAADGVEGLALFQQERYDLVLTDLGMPGLTGWEVAGAVRQRTPTVGVILITGRATEEVAGRARAEGLPLVPKPFSLDTLKTVVAKALRAVERSDP